MPSSSLHDVLFELQHAALSNSVRNFGEAAVAAGLDLPGKRVRTQLEQPEAASSNKAHSDAEQRAGEDGAGGTGTNGTPMTDPAATATNIAADESILASARYKITSLQQMYLYGLTQISKLDDLRDAPDAIMPGNFPPPPGPDDDK